MKQILVFDIKWDTDDNEYDNEDLSLPAEMLINPYDIPDVQEDTSIINDNDMLSDAISDYISNKTGFCHFGFNYDWIDKILQTYKTNPDINTSLINNIKAYCTKKIETGKCIADECDTCDINIAYHTIRGEMYGKNES